MVGICVSSSDASPTSTPEPDITTSEAQSRGWYIECHIRWHIGLTKKPAVT
jgi:hypothetical protein